MRKLVTQAEKDRKRKRNMLILGIMGLGLIGLMLLSPVGFAFGNKKSDYKGNIIDYGAIKFNEDNSGEWRFIVDGNQFVTNYNPEEVQEINVFGFLTLNQYVNQPLYIVGEYPSAKFEIIRNIEKFTLRTGLGCLDEECEQDAPIKNCSIDNVISIKEPEEGENEQIYFDENCVFIVAELNNQTRYVDAFLFKILGVN